MLRFEDRTEEKVISFLLHNLRDFNTKAAGVEPFLSSHLADSVTRSCQGCGFLRHRPVEGVSAHTSEECY